MMQVNNQDDTAVNPDSECGEFELMLLNILIKTRNRVIKRAILPGITSGSITKLAYKR